MWQFLTIGFLRHKKLEKFADNHGHNILRPFDSLPNFLFTKSETKRDYW